MSGRDRGNHLAVIGMAGRFPGARDVDELWRNLEAGVESVSFFDDDELRAAGVDPAESGRPDYVPARGCLDGVDLFDAAFFGFSPREAEIMDPQQRLFLECAWHALEDAGYGGPHRPEAIGLYAACGMNNYLMVNLMRNPEVLASVGAGYIRVANRLDNLATRTSYKLDLRGPSVNVQTGCSSSLVGVHLACQGLLSGETDLALAGGVRVNILERRGYVAEEGSVLSPDGHTRTFDARAGGTIVGDGVAAVVLKRLDDALEDGDPVRAVILGSAVNNDGSRKIGYTAPSVEGQARVVSEALAMAGVDADSISYVEAHGTATPLGDPIEIAGLTQAFRATTDRRGFCAIGSIKSNFGHLDSASGVTGLIKAVLALGHRRIPPSLHFERPNPEIDFEASPFRVADRLLDWPAGERPRRAGVSSFGIGGTNAHAVLEEAPPADPSGPARPAQLLAVSARSAEAALQAGRALAAHLAGHQNAKAADVTYTLQAGRAAFEHRRAVILRSPKERAADAAADLADPASERAIVSAGPAADRPVVFLFPGQGAQRPGMGAALYRDEPVFRDEVDRAVELAAPHLDFDLEAVLDPRRPTGRSLDDTEVAQPALFVIEHALARLWMRWGVRPEAMAGHSLGEYVAACLAGVLSLDDALALVAARGRAMQSMPDGAMLAVPLAPEALAGHLGGALSLAAVNAPSASVVSGRVAAIEELAGRLAAEGVETRRLRTARAFHSPMVEPAVAPFAERLREVELRSPSIPFLSNLTGTWIRPEQATDPGYWIEHLRSTVRFADNVAELAREPRRVLLEVGPGRTLTGLARRHPECDPAQLLVATLPGPAGPEEGGEGAGLPETLDALGRLWCAGIEVDWSGVHDGERRHRLRLPGYPFERQRYWVSPSRVRGSAGGRPGVPERRADVGEWLYAPSWRRLPPLAASADGADHAGETWMVFEPDSPSGRGSALASRLAGHLSRSRARVVTVHAAAAGAGLARRGDDVWSLDPAEAGGYRELVAALADAGAPPDRVAHLWSVDGDAGAETGADSPRRSFDARQRDGFLSLIHLARALSDLPTGHRCRVVAVSNGLEEVLGDEPLDPAKATLAGACRVVPQEHPGIECRRIDADPGTTVDDERLLAEVLAEDETAPPVVALRGGARWCPGFEPLPARVASGERPPARLRRGGVYLVFGGLGRIGLALADWLVRDLDARVVLAGRGAGDPSPATARRLREIEDAGGAGAVHAVAADIADEDAVRSAVAVARERFGALHGVIHAAGLTRSFQAVRETTAETADLHFRPKAGGCRALAAALADPAAGGDLDFVLLLSSLSAELGGFGYAAHSAAHRFLDLFAAERSRGGGVPWLSVGLDGWSFGASSARRGVGAGDGAADLAMRPEEGIEALRRFLDRPEVVRAAVSTFDLERRAADAGEPVRSAARAPETPNAEARDGDAAAGGAHGRPALQNAYVAAENDSERRIAEIWSELLGITPVGVTDDFFELGGHSLLGVQIVSRLREAFRIEIPMRRVFERTTVRGLAEMVEELLLAEIESMSDEEAERYLEGATG